MAKESFTGIKPAAIMLSQKPEQYPLTLADNVWVLNNDGSHRTVQDFLEDGKLSLTTGTITFNGKDFNLPNNSGTLALKSDLTAALFYQGTKTSYDELLKVSSSSKKGDIWNVASETTISTGEFKGVYPTGTNFAYNGTEWDPLGGTTEQYLKIEAAYPELGTNKTVLGAIGNVDTLNTADKNNLVGAVNNVNTAVSSITSTVSGLQGQVNANKTTISANTANINSLIDKFNDISISNPDGSNITVSGDAGTKKYTVDIVKTPTFSGLTSTDNVVMAKDKALVFGVAPRYSELRSIDLSESGQTLDWIVHDTQGSQQLTTAYKLKAVPSTTSEFTLTIPNKTGQLMLTNDLNAGNNIEVSGTTIDTKSNITLKAITITDNSFDIYGNSSAEGTYLNIWKNRTADGGGVRLLVPNTISSTIELSFPNKKGQLMLTDDLVNGSNISISGTTISVVSEPSFGTIKGIAQLIDSSGDQFFATGASLDFGISAKPAHIISSEKPQWVTGGVVQGTFAMLSDIPAAITVSTATVPGASLIRSITVDGTSYNLGGGGSGSVDVSGGTLIFGDNQASEDALKGTEALTKVTALPDANSASSPTFVYYNDGLYCKVAVTASTNAYLALK